MSQAETIVSIDHYSPDEPGGPYKSEEGTTITPPASATGEAPTPADFHATPHSLASRQSWLMGRIRSSCTEGTNKPTDSYTVGKELGKGGFGTVSLVKKIGGKDTFAMKSITGTKLADRKIEIEAFEKELDIAKQLKHPHIVMIHEYFKEEDNYHIVMDYFQGGDLSKVIQGTTMGGDRGLPTRAVGIYIWQILSGLAYLHHYNFVHRDVKPENLMLDRQPSRLDDGRINVSTRRWPALKLIDFGAARQRKTGMSLATQIGTAGYAAPEVFSDPRPYDETVDLFSAGIVAFEICCADFPFDGEDDETLNRNVMKQVVSFEVPAWKRHPEELKRLVTLLASKDPSARGSAKDYLKENEWVRSFKAAAMEDQGSGEPCCNIQ